jgi:nitrile hydratase accessory protein
MTPAEPVSRIPDLSALPAIPRDQDGPVFAAPWEAQAFAMTVRLHERGHFTWREWTDAITAEIAAARVRGDVTTPYYEHWLAALEKLVAAKGLVSRPDLLKRKDEWDRAARATPHGQPIVLQRGQ